MWNKLISLNTNFIRFYDSTDIDLIKSAISKNPECIKYYKMNNLYDNYDKFEEVEENRKIYEI